MISIYILDGILPACIKISLPRGTIVIESRDYHNVQCVFSKIKPHSSLCLHFFPSLLFLYFLVTDEEMRYRNHRKYLMCEK